MLKKRLIGVVTVRNNLAVQSVGYRRYLPLGKPECLVENLDRWGADEILVQVIDRSIDGLGPDFSLVERLGRLGLGTPLIYSGGVRSVEDGVRLIRSGADRLAVDAMIRDSPKQLGELATQLGSQALIAALPLSIDAGELFWYDYRKKHQAKFTSQDINIITSALFSEVLAIDWRNEGVAEKFDERLIRSLPFKKPIISFGGISTSDKIKNLFRMPEVVAVAIGNFLSYREHALQEYKSLLSGMPIRFPKYASADLE